MHNAASLRQALLYFGYYRGNDYWYYNEAYSVTMMIGVYMVGRYLYKVIDKLEKIKYWYLVFAFTGIIGLMSIVRILSSNEEAWLHYGSPITMLAAVLLFMLFYRIPKFQSKSINKIASSCLASFILHTCDPVFSWLVHKDVMWFINDVYFVYCLKIGIAILGVFIFAIILDKIRLLIFSPVIKLSRRIKQLN